MRIWKLIVSYNVNPASLLLFSFSDHRLIFCTRNTSIIKTDPVYNHTNFRSMNNGRIHDYKKNLRQIVLQLKSFKWRQSCILRFLWENCVSYRQNFRFYIYKCRFYICRVIYIIYNIYIYIIYIIYIYIYICIRKMLRFKITRQQM